MDKFEYLPQLIVAYDSKDEFANLIHVKKADKDSDYYCPCCGGTVKPRAIESTKEQSHYYHITGKCTKESQMHFFCKHWLFEEGSKFVLAGETYEVDNVEIEKPYETSFGRYIPDIIVHTKSGDTIFFELFFTNRKRGDDYFCKWSELGNDVVEVNLKEYCNKVVTDEIPIFNYLFHDNKCYSLNYVNKDFYANTIARRKIYLERQEVLNYKSRIESLDWFWQLVINKMPKEDILFSIENMEYDDQVFCYDIVKNKQCVKYLREDIKNIINNGVLKNIENQISLPKDEFIYINLIHHSTNIYEVSLHVKYQTEHFNFDEDILLRSGNCWDYKNLVGFPKIKFTTKIYEQIHLTDDDIKNVNEKYQQALIEKNKVLNFEESLKNDFSYKEYVIDKKFIKIKDESGYIYYFSHEFSLENVNKCILLEKNRIDENNKFKMYLQSDEYKLAKNKIISLYPGMKIEFCENCEAFLYDYSITVKSYGAIIGEYKIIDYDSIVNHIGDIWNKYKEAYKFIKKINECKNGLWSARLSNIDSIYNFIPKIFITFLPFCRTKSFEMYYSYEYNVEEATEIMNKLIEDSEKYNNVKIIWEVVD